MEDKKKTKAELLKENTKLRRQVKKLQNAEIKSRQIENELFQSRAMLQLIMDTIPQCVYWKDTNLNYLGCNEKFAEDISIDNPFDIIGKNDFELTWNNLSGLNNEDEKEDENLVGGITVPLLQTAR